MRNQLSKLGKVKAGLHATQALFIFIAWALTIAVLTRDGGIGGQTWFYFVLVGHEMVLEVDSDLVAVLHYRASTGLSGYGPDLPTSSTLRQCLRLRRCRHPLRDPLVQRFRSCRCLELSRPQQGQGGQQGK